MCILSSKLKVVFMFSPHLHTPTHTHTFLPFTGLVWKIGDDVAGYVSCMVVVRGGGHILPFDQPERALNLIQNFVNMQ